ncbi:probable serine/threonine-protein kinase DDB_G0282963 [Hyalella azteca]|uniref:Probable serine/threonine-protein kinase DDB_G0282963 n=1 Tax=Hyalella azteca TaxID=294128 RepID=A0A8B7N403_HYAAZ|nr:probable serine/threonine-protein kinase DDB_G0282963 [Hyalella azteca]
MAFSFPVTELTLRVGGTPLPKLNTNFPQFHQLPPLPSVDVGSLFLEDRNFYYGQDKSGTARRSSNNGERNNRKQRTSAQVRRNNAQQNVTPRRHKQGTSIARIVNIQNAEISSKVDEPKERTNADIEKEVGSVRSDRTNHDKTTKASQFERRNGELPVNLPQQLLLTPLGPLEWREMVSNSKSPHFLLVPATPIKATWVGGADTEVVQPAPREESHSENQKSPNIVSPHPTLLQPTHTTTHIEVDGIRTYSTKPSSREHDFGTREGKQKEFSAYESSSHQNPNENNQGNMEGRKDNEMSLHENNYQNLGLHRGNLPGEVSRVRGHFREGDNFSNRFQNHGNMERDPLHPNREDTEHSNPGFLRIESTNHSNRRIDHNGPAVSNPSFENIETMFRDSGEQGTIEESRDHFRSVSPTNIQWRDDEKKHGNYREVGHEGLRTGISGQDNMNSDREQDQRAQIFGKQEVYNPFIKTGNWHGFSNGNDHNNRDNVSWEDHSTGNKDGWFDSSKGDHEGLIGRHEQLHETQGSSFDESPITEKKNYINFVLENNKYITAEREMNQKSGGFSSITGLKTSDHGIGNNEEHSNVQRNIQLYGTPWEHSSNRHEINEGFNDHSSYTRSQGQPQTEIRRLQNSYRQDGKLTNDEIINNTALTTRYSKRLSHISDDQSMRPLPQLATVDSTRHSNQEVHLQINEPMTPINAPTSFHVQTFSKLDSGLRNLKHPSAVHHKMTSYSSASGINIDTRIPSRDTARYTFTERDAVTKQHKTPVTNPHTVRNKENFEKLSFQSGTPLSNFRDENDKHTPPSSMHSIPQPSGSHGNIAAVSSKREDTESPDNEKLNSKAISNLPGHQDVYQYASSIHSSNLQNFQHEEPEAVNLFEAIHSLSSKIPITYIQYTTPKSIIEEGIGMKDTFGRPRFEQNPFFKNFGPFPQSQPGNYGTTPRPDDAVVTVTPADVQVNSTISGKSSSLTYPDGVYFIPMDISEQSSNDEVSTVQNFGKSKPENNSASTNSTSLTTEENGNSKNAKQGILGDIGKNDGSSGSVLIRKNINIGRRVIGGDETAAELHSFEDEHQLNFNQENDMNFAPNLSGPIIRNKTPNIIDEKDEGHMTPTNGTSRDAKLDNKADDPDGDSRVWGHRTGGALLDALVTFVKKASADKQSLQEMLPPFSVLEVGVGELLVSPTLSADAPDNSTFTGTDAATDSSAFTSMMQLGIVLGVVVVVAVLLFHAPRMRRELCSSEKRERLRRLKQRYADDNVSSSSIEFSSMGRKSYKNTTGMHGYGDDGRSQEDKSDGESHYARVNDVNL